MGSAGSFTSTKFVYGYAEDSEITVLSQVYLEQQCGRDEGVLWSQRLIEV